MTSNSPERPAILGGTSAVTSNHSIANKWPILSEDDEQAVLKIIRDGNISTHSIIRELESDYCQFANRKYSLAHNNGTSALLAAYFALGLKPGDEVLVPSATFWASVVPMLWLGLIPVFCESENERLGLDPEDVRNKITDKTRAMMIVHLWGLPSKMTSLIEIGDQFSLKIIEDASHAHGASWNNRPCGSLGDISIFSLQGDKLAPGGEGGIFLCDDYKYYEKAICLGDITRIIELDSPAKRFAATSFGIKTRITPISAAIAKNQLKQLPRNNLRRNENLIYLSQALEKIGFHTFLPPNHIQRVYFEFIIRYNPERNCLPIETLIEALEKEGCEISTPRYPLLHQQPIFTEGVFKDIIRISPETDLPIYKPDSLPQTQAVNDVLIKLPSFPNADKKILDQYILAFNKVIKNAEEILKHCD